MRPSSRKSLSALALTILALPGVTAMAQRTEVPEWVGKIRADHPRLFFSADTWPAVKAQALGPMQEHYAKVKEVVDKLPAELESKDYGFQALNAAFVYRVTEDPKYLELARKLLDTSVEFYHARIAAGVMVNWYSHTRLSALAAWDWIYNEVPEDWRTQWGGAMLEHVAQVQPYPGWRDDFGPGRCNRSGYTTGFYGTTNLAWFGGLAMLNEGIDDERALDLLLQGYDLNMKLLEHRRAASGDDGGSASPTLGYAMGAYPWAEFNFFHTWKSATGEQMALQWPYVALFANYVMWNYLPEAHEFGYGDAGHTTNKMTRWNMCLHMAQTMHFYAESQPDWVGLARHVQGLFPEHYSNTHWGCHPFLLTRTDQAPAARDPGLLPHARHFETMGQIFMRSGSGPEDTYAAFTAGGILSQHRHFDNNNFCIHKRGFLAIDSGTRVGNADQLQNYYAQTVAHNCILIDMPDEAVSNYWNGTVFVQEGGQCQQIGSRPVAFETNDDFTYIASDATEAYRPEKCELALRQFVFIYPNHFVVFDRVRSTQADYRKRWLLHTAREPRIEGTTISADQGEGRIFCRTLLPEDAQLTAIGGPGKEFMAGGKNWPLLEKGKYGGAPEYSELMGWGRVEVTPGTPRGDDVFLHLIQVGDQTVVEMCEATLVREEASVGVQFAAGDRSVRVTFATEGEAAGHIRIVRGDEVLTDQDLTQEVMPQEGLAARAE